MFSLPHTNAMSKAFKDTFFQRNSTIMYQTILAKRNGYSSRLSYPLWRVGGEENDDYTYLLESQLLLVSVLLSNNGLCLNMTI